MNSTFSDLLAYLDSLSWADVESLAEAAQVPFHTVAKIKRRETANPRIHTVEALMAHINVIPDSAIVNDSH